MNTVDFALSAISQQSSLPVGKSVRKCPDCGADYECAQPPFLCFKCGTAINELTGANGAEGLNCLRRQRAQLRTDLEKLNFKLIEANGEIQRLENERDQLKEMVNDLGRDRDRMECERDNAIERAEVAESQCEDLRNGLDRS